MVTAYHCTHSIYEEVPCDHSDGESSDNLDFINLISDESDGESLDNLNFI